MTASLREEICQVSLKVLQLLVSQLARHSECENLASNIKLETSTT